jgi:hypothetical protein
VLSCLNRSGVDDSQVVIHEMSNTVATDAHDYYMIFDLYHSVEVEAWTAESEHPPGNHSGGHHHTKEKLRAQAITKQSAPAPTTPTCYMTGNPSLHLHHHHVKIESWTDGGLNFAAGYGSGWFSELWGQCMATVEVTCAATGQSDCCRFVVAPPHRILHYLRFLGAALNQPMATLAALPMLHLFAQDKDGERCAWGHSFECSVSQSQ